MSAGFCAAATTVVVTVCSLALATPGETCAGEHTTFRLQAVIDGRFAPAPAGDRRGEIRGEISIVQQSRGRSIASPNDGMFRGRTAQGHQITLFVNDGAVTQYWRITVRGSTCWMTSLGGKPTTVTGGRFTLHAGELVVRGRFTAPTALQGTITWRECAPGRPVRFTARWAR